MTNSVTIRFEKGSDENEFFTQLSYENVTALMAWEGLKVFLNFIDEVADKTIPIVEARNIFRNGTSALRLSILGTEACLETLQKKTNFKKD